jgi:cis-3-alkyl-4-acyloxetan-2-one decarboxylase
MLRETIVHKLFRRPYQLAVAVDQGSGPVIVFLHGIATSSHTWSNVLPYITPNYRVVCLDLLGFGASPKPSWKNYDIGDHASSVLATLGRLGIRGPITLVGHSMGALISVEVTVRRPRLVSRLVLVSMPLYKTRGELPLDKTRRLDSVYERVYQYLASHESRTLRQVATLQRIIPEAAGFDLNGSNWTPFKRSLQKTILQQQTLNLASQITIPTRLLSGRLDPFVITGYLKEFASGHDNMELLLTNAGHDMSRSYGRLIADEIVVEDSRVPGQITSA